MAHNLVILDGSFGEGGGAILRVASALSVIKKKPIHIFNIRKGRKEPGLKPQHLLGLKSVAKLCNGYLEGDEIGSEEIKFYPGEIKAQDLHIKIETAGSITLLMQSILPVAIFAPSPVKIVFDGGGTDVPFSPTLDYFKFCFLKILEKMGVKIETKIIKRGYYPVGGSKMEVKIFPAKLKPLNLIERGKLEKIFIISVASESLKEKKVAERQLRGAEEVFKKLKLPIEKKIEYWKTDSPGSSILVAAQFENTILGSDNLGKLGVPAEIIGREASLNLLKEEKYKGALDRYLGDQILIYMALAGKGEVSTCEITSHAKTNMWVIEKFVPGKFEVEGNLIKWIPSQNDQ